jgi:hypothetical protein
MTVDGELFRQPTPSLLLAIRARITGGNASGLSLPTPLARDWRSGKVSEATMQRNSRPLSEKIGGKLNPQWVEWLMGWPIGWTDCEPLATDKFQQWRLSHGDC